MARDETAPGPGETLNRLAGEWWIYQLERGQRYSTDDVLLAWTAVEAMPRASRVLDLGAGVGSVGLMTLLLLPEEATLTSVEIQAVSAELLGKTVAYNGVDDRVRVVRGDLRDDALLKSEGQFDLIAANPPYLPESSSLTSPNDQRAGARLERHGDIYDYCRAAARLLDVGGRFCFCHSAADPRPERAVEEAGLSLLSRRDVVFREGKQPVISLFVCACGGTREDASTLVVRLADGGRTDEFRAVRRRMLIEA